ncbi:MAG: peroxiredoxin [Geobacteraceae bacterium]|nr:peroxiredoxin [Geobacteraceae bacterium]
MKYLALIITVVLGISISGAAGAAANSNSTTASLATTGSEVGSHAPPFTLDAVENLEFRKISLSDYRGKWVVLFFYPGDFTFVCPTEIKGFNKALGEFKAANTEILAASVDSKFSHLAWIKSGALDKLDFPLLSDLSKQAARAYGVLDEETSYARRGLFIIDPNGVIQYRIVHSDKVGRSVEETLRVLKALQTEELCPINWKPGEKTIKR